MPKSFDNTCFYIIKCNNADIKESYVGSSVDYKNRIYVHKADCNNDKRNHLPLYKCMNANGGFGNWTFSLLEIYNGKSKMDILMREQYWINTLKPTLNKNKPIVLNEGKPLIIDDELDAEEKNRQRSSFRRECIDKELDSLKKENEELKEENNKIKELLKIYLSKS